MKNPTWWTNEHTSTWDRVKDALKRDWEQTKADFSKKSGAELDQNAADTVKQAAGKEPIPPGKMPNAKPADWEKAEPSYRYGVGARSQYGKQSGTWDDRVESQLASEWKGLGTDDSWDDAKANVRHGYERGGK